ncbi:insulinase family protein, partial [bacterium]
VKPRIKAAVANPKVAAVAENVNKVNAFPASLKAENGDKAPATLDDVIAIGKFPASTFEDVDGKPLTYDATKGEVSSRQPVPKTVAAPSAPKIVTPEPQLVTLPNGVQLILNPNSSAPTVSIVAMGTGGTRLENENELGISNVAAQLLTRGTQKRTEEQIAQLVDDLGGELSGFSGNNAWGVESSWLAGDWKRGLNLVAESVLQPIFPAPELSKVKTQTLDALGSQDDDPMTSASLLLRKTFYGKHPYGRNPLGTEAAVKSLTREQLVGYWRRSLQPKNTVIAVSGRFDSVQMERSARALFGSFAGTGSAIKAPGEVTPPPSFTRVEKNKPGIAQAVLWYGFPSVNVKNEDRFPLDVLDAALSGAGLPGGRLHERLRNDQLVYVVHAYDSPSVDGGMFVIYAATGKENRTKVRTIIEEEINKVRQADITPEELERAKSMMIAAHAIDLQTNDAQARDLASDALFGLGIQQSSEYAAKINAVTLADVRRVANQYLKMENAALAVVQPQ